MGVFWDGGKGAPIPLLLVHCGAFLLAARSPLCRSHCFTASSRTPSGRWSTIATRAHTTTVPASPPSLPTELGVAQRVRCRVRPMTSNHSLPRILASGCDGNTQQHATCDACPLILWLFQQWYFLRQRARERHVHSDRQWTPRAPGGGQKLERVKVKITCT